MHSESRINILAPILAWLLPGLGHWWLGHRSRALLIGAGVLGLYTGGLLIGGLDVIDRRGDFLWYCGQVLAGPQTPALQMVRNARPAPDDPDTAVNYTYAQPSFSHANEIGQLYAAIAGMLNLLAILDVIILAPASAPMVDRRKPSPAT